MAVILFRWLGLKMQFSFIIVEGTCCDIPTFVPARGPIDPYSVATFDAVCFGLANDCLYKRLSFALFTLLISTLWCCYAD